MASRPEGSWHTRAFRIVSRRYPPFDGAGAHRWGSRWISPGRRVVHAAETFSLAVLENLVHWQASALPPDLCCVEVSIPAELAQEEVTVTEVPGFDAEDYAASRAVGDEWYDRGDTCVLWVPSVASPYESNVLFNQRHPHFPQLIVGEPQPARIDERLLTEKRRTSLPVSPAPRQPRR